MFVKLVALENVNSQQGVPIPNDLLRPSLSILEVPPSLSLPNCSVCNQREGGERSEGRGEGGERGENGERREEVRGEGGEEERGYLPV